MLKNLYIKFISIIFSNKFIINIFKFFDFKFNNTLNFSTKNTNFFNKKAIYLNSFFKKNFYQTVATYALYTKTYIAVADASLTNLNHFFVKYKPTDLSLLYSSFISNFSSNNPIFYFLRKHKLFNKGRYSRNRQVYRTGLYWCLWVNILAVTGFYYWFYRFTMNFGYLWPFFSLFVLSFFIPRALKYNYLYLNNLTSSIIKLVTWFFYIFKDLYTYIYSVAISFLNFLNINLKLSTKSSFSIFFIFSLLFNVLNLIKLLSSYFFLVLNDSTDLLKKTYSHWNYFLPIGWIHKDHRLFFYKRLFYIFFK